MRRFGYPNNKITEYVLDIQVKKGLKKKDFFFDKIRSKNIELLEIDEKKIEERMNAVKPFEEVYKKIEQQQAGEHELDRPPLVPDELVV